MIKFGDKARDTVTDFEGIVTAKVEYMNGEIRYELTPIAEGGVLRESEYFDRCRLIKIEEGGESRPK